MVYFRAQFQAPSCLRSLDRQTDRRLCTTQWYTGLCATTYRTQLFYCGGNPLLRRRLLPTRRLSHAVCLLHPLTDGAYVHTNRQHFMIIQSLNYTN